MNIQEQRELECKINNEIKMLGTSLVEDLFKNNLINIEDIQNLWLELDKEEQKEYGEEYRQQNIYEYWFINKWLYEELKKENEPVINSDYGYIWGRTCAGQSISMDHIIQKIFNFNN